MKRPTGKTLAALVAISIVCVCVSAACLAALLRESQREPVVHHDAHPPHTETAPVTFCATPAPSIPDITLDPNQLITGDAVGNLQTSLNTIGATLAVDKTYGPLTNGAKNDAVATINAAPPCSIAPPLLDVADKITVLAGQAADLTSAREAARAAAVVASPAAKAKCSGDAACLAEFLRCTRQVESDRGDAGGQGNYDQGYGAIDPSGKYRGAYQFDQSTWDGVVGRLGLVDEHGVSWVGRDPATAPPNVQDAAATQLYAERGNQPWGGRC